MEKETLEFRVDTNQLLTEITEFGLPRTMGVLYRPINIFRNYLCRVAERAIELNDPKMNILMLSLGLYEVQNREIPAAIEQQKKIIEQHEKEQKIKDAAPELLRACLLAYVKLTSIGEHNCEQTAKILDNAIKKATE